MNINYSRGLTRKREPWGWWSIPTKETNLGDRLPLSKTRIQLLLLKISTGQRRFWYCSDPQVIGAEAGKQGSSVGTSKPGTLFWGARRDWQNWKPWLRPGPQLLGILQGKPATRGGSRPQEAPHLGSWCKATEGDAGQRRLQEAAAFSWPPASGLHARCCRSLACRSWPRERGARSTNGWTQRTRFRLHVPPAPSTDKA